MLCCQVSSSQADLECSACSTLLARQTATLAVLAWLCLPGERIFWCCMPDMQPEDMLMSAALPHRHAIDAPYPRSPPRPKTIKTSTS